LNSEAHRLQRQGRHQEAEPLLREALRKRPDYPYAEYNLGWSLVRQGKSRDAVLYLKKSSQAQPRRWEPLDKLADAYQQLGDRKKAEAARSRAQELKGTPRRKKDHVGDRASGGEPEVRSAVAPAAWQQSTDRREEAWFQERRELAPVRAADGGEH